MTKHGLDKKTDLLTQAMRKVFKECMDSKRTTIKEDYKAMESCLNGHKDSLEAKADTKNKNM